MKNIFIYNWLIITFLATTFYAVAQESDTTYIASRELGDVMVTSIKVNSPLEKLPLASSEIQLEGARSEVATLKNVSAIVPNFFMPDYGSSITSAVYIRGVGSRINTPAVALYVDDAPYIDKSSFTFDFVDVERIEIVRGPQGTLYGRNSMGGVVNILTVSPFRDVQKTSVRVSGVLPSKEISCFVNHRQRLGQQFAFAAEAFYSRGDGFFRNVSLDVPADDFEKFGAKVRGSFLFQNDLKLDISASYERTDECGYAYEYLGSLAETESLVPYIGKIATNRSSSYDRHLLGANVKLLKSTDDLIVTNVVGFQGLSDKMSLDQDFLPTDTFYLDQTQRLRTITEELVVKRRDKTAVWQWTTGLFGYGQWLRTECPVQFAPAGVAMIQSSMSAAMLAAGAPLTITFVDDQILVNTLASTPSFGLALYHQSSYDVVDWLNVALGLRVDYEHLSIDYDASTAINYMMKMGTMQSEKVMSVEYAGALSDNYLRLLPKFSATANLSGGGNVYVTVARGQRSGCYNVQTFSDIVSASFSASSLTDDEVANAIRVKPESCWNYEIGTHLTIAEVVKCSLAAFYMDIRNQQIAKFSEGGLGRRLENAGRSASVGAEVSMQAKLLSNRLLLGADYGYTNSHFTSYETLEDDLAVDYSGNRVPFVPDQTLNIRANYVLFESSKALKRLTFGLDFAVVGKIFWTEDNLASQSAYGQLNARIGADFGALSVNIWGRNLTDSQFYTFYFQSMNHAFAQRGKPQRAGVELTYTF